MAYLNSKVKYEIPKFNANVSIFYKYNGKYPQLIFEGVENEPSIAFYAPYNTLDFTLSKLFWKRRINLQIGGKNLFDVRNINMTGSTTGGIHSGGSGSQAVAWGRTFFIRLQISINK